MQNSENTDQSNTSTVLLPHGPHHTPSSFKWGKPISSLLLSLVTAILLWSLNLPGAVSLFLNFSLSFSLFDDGYSTNIFLKRSPVKKYHSLSLSLSFWIETNTTRRKTWWVKISISLFYFVVIVVVKSNWTLFVILVVFSQFVASNVLPRWLEVLLTEKFYNACIIHEEAKKNEKNVYCLDCCISLCPHCLSPHHSHRLLQVFLTKLLLLSETS